MNEVKILGTYPCPKCASTKRVFDEAHKELEARGLHGHMEVCFFTRDARPLLDIQAAVLTMPVVTIYWDHCYDCGQLYTFRIDTQDAPIQFQTPQVN